MMPKQVVKANATIFSEWDALADIRFQQITSGDDLTFNHVLAPCLIDLAKRHKAEVIIDAGCGVGVLCERLMALNADLIGVDPSAQSIQLAKQHFGTYGTFVADTLEGFAADNAEIADLIVSNMVIMDVPDLNGFVAAVATLLKPGGSFIFSMGHPCFWPQYANFADAEWFNYSREQMVETPFRISNSAQPQALYTHIHRPLSQYTKALSDAGLAVEQIIEPLPKPEIEVRYPKKWAYPRFLVMECHKL